jgi:dephospho-CoA kinase
MLKVGLTGSIAVGKSYVCECFRELECHVLDADKTSREVVEPNTPGLTAVVNAFGSEILTSNGELDRKALGAIVFSDDGKRNLLNSIIHPLVIAAQDQWIRSIEAQDPSGIAIVDAALMIESNGYKRFDKIIVVWCEPKIQLTRLMARDGLTETEARNRIDAQMPQEDKKLFADILIDTSAGREKTRSRVAEVFAELRDVRKNVTFTKTT